MPDYSNPWYRDDDHSDLEVFNIQTGKRTVLHSFDHLIEAPNWTPDGRALIYNSKGRMYRFDLQTKACTCIDSGFADNCNNDHVVSADGQHLAFSHQPAEDGRSRVYVLPISGGVPRLITPLGPSYLHGLSPDGQTFAYCAERDGEFDVYTTRLGDASHAETRLTFAPGLNDGPEYSADGRYIYFNSVRTGLMQAWRMRADGSEQEQLTFDEDLNTWFPHVAPDGRHVCLLSYHKGDVQPGEHLPHQNVVLRLLDLETGCIRNLCTLFGGQGTINVNSWAPDSTRFAFVSYRIVPKEAG